MHNFDTDWESPVSQDINSDNHVDVPETNFPINVEQLNELRENIDPLWHSNFHGIDCYLETLQFFHSQDCILIYCITRAGPAQF